jgi:probable rRNA maturation factor
MSVEVVSHVPGRKLPLRRTKQAAQKILASLKQNRAELSVALITDREIEKLNRKYRNKPKPTDVLSFPAGELLAGRQPLLGDVVISVERAEEQAKAGGWTLDEEIDRLLIHGILHLLGYDHERSRKAALVMRSMERKVCRELCGKKAAAL